jgi:hypothetical protein
MGAAIGFLRFFVQGYNDTEIRYPASNGCKKMVSCRDKVAGQYRVRQKQAVEWQKEAPNLVQFQAAGADADHHAVVQFGAATADAVAPLTMLRSRSVTIRASAACPSGEASALCASSASS